MMHLKEIYRPIKKELDAVDQTIINRLKSSKYKSILKTSNYLFIGGKKLRPALVILSAKAISNSKSLATNSQLINIASALELIHIASLVHDDVIDHSLLRRNETTINSKWGNDISIALGDYLYSVAFEMIADCGNPDIIRCVSSATKAMCEGELIQVCERENLDLLKERYILIVKKKTASLFAASCQAGALLSDTDKLFENALRDYGLNFGIVFQIVDDYLDIVGDKDRIGRTPGQDIKVGEITLPILSLLGSTSRDKRQELEKLLKSERKAFVISKIREKFLNSGAIIKTKKTAQSFIGLAKDKIGPLKESSYKQSLLGLADFILERGFGV